ESTGNAVSLTEEELRLLTKRAKAYIPQRVQLYAKLMDVSYGRISIRTQKSRWGSCSSKKNLNFNCLLMLTPIEVIDSVVVHELSHLRQMNHSKKFYEEIYSVFPDYDKWNKWLKENGSAIMARLK
ncbi:MAG: M48 family metallopeptidase, partial [Clostridiales bacterium]|nr:M48 family metallopeptidase [Clostridiales bacterium]